jgi:crotonobetainyl-CoA:carnitine CoA-transferase CaiB-like acyl-CoA transferase
MTDQALTGVRVVEFCDEIGSYGGRLLADLGADVIKVEPPGGGVQRRTPPFYRDQETPETSLLFWTHNTSKRSIVLDLATPEGVATARRLAATADIVLEDRPVGALAALGLGYEALAAERPALVYVSVTGFGQTGPHARWASSDIVAQATAGVMTLAGFPDDPPNQIVGNQAWFSASIQAAEGAMGALLHAEATGEGQYVDVSAQEATLFSQETAMQTWDLQHRNKVRTGVLGSLFLEIPGTGLYPTREGMVFMQLLSRAGLGWPGLRDWMRERGAMAELDEEPYLSLISTLNMETSTQAVSDPEAVKRLIPLFDRINEVLRAFAMTMTAKELYEEGQRRRLLIGIVSTPRDLAESTQLEARAFFRELAFEALGFSVRFPGPPYRLSETPAVIRRPPRLGEHTAAILAELAAGAAR